MVRSSGTEYNRTRHRREVDRIFECMCRCLSPARPGCGALVSGPPPIRPPVGSRHVSIHHSRPSSRRRHPDSARPGHRLRVQHLLAPARRPDLSAGGHRSGIPAAGSRGQEPGRRDRGRGHCRQSAPRIGAAGLSQVRVFDLHSLLRGDHGGRGARAGPERPAFHRHHRRPAHGRRFPRRRAHEPLHRVLPGARRVRGARDAAVAGAVPHAHAQCRLRAKGDAARRAPRHRDHMCHRRGADGAALRRAAGRDRPPLHAVGDGRASWPAPGSASPTCARSRR